MVDAVTQTETGETTVSLLEFYRSQNRILLPIDNLAVAEEIFIKGAPELVRGYTSREDFLRAGFGARCLLGSNTAGSRIVEGFSVVDESTGIQIDETAYCDDFERENMRPLVVYHETRELWYRVIPGGIHRFLGNTPGDYKIYTDSELAHLLALVEEYFQAIQLGTDLLGFMLKIFDRYDGELGDQKKKMAIAQSGIALKIAKEEKDKGKSSLDKNALRRYVWEQKNATQYL